MERESVADWDKKKKGIKKLKRAEKFKKNEERDIYREGEKAPNKYKYDYKEGRNKAVNSVLLPVFGNVKLLLKS